MADELTPLGKIQVSPKAIATIAYNAAMESYGVVGLASKSFLDGLANVIVKDPTHGIEVQFDGSQIVVDVYIIIEYGTRIKSVAASVANTVKYHVEHALSLPVHAVNVHVQGLRISELDE